LVIIAAELMAVELIDYQGHRFIIAAVLHRSEI